VRGPDFTTFDEMKALLQHYPFPADGIYRQTPTHYEVRVTPIPGPSFVGTTPLAPDAEAFFRSKNWRRNYSVSCGVEGRGRGAVRRERKRRSSGRR
jgi:hypothetical protein